MIPISLQQLHIVASLLNFPGIILELQQQERIMRPGNWRQDRRVNQQPQPSLATGSVCSGLCYFAQLHAWVVDKKNQRQVTRFCSACTKWDVSVSTSSFHGSRSL